MRRETLAALFLAAAAGIVIAQASLTQGPVVGGVTEAGAVVWIRTSASASVSVAFSITPDLAGAQVVVGVTDAAKDSTALIPLTGLSPSTTYYYNVLVEGAPVFSADFPRFRTFPAPGSDTEVSFAFGSCQSDGNHPIFSSIAAKDPLFFLQNGDFGYPDAMDPSTKLERQRQNFRAQYDPAHPLAGVLLRTAPLVYVWDDHDYGGNNSDKNQPGKEYSLQAYRDYVPGYPLAQDAIGVWHSFRAGNAEFFALDCRSQRDPELTSWNDRLNPDRSMLNGTDLPATQSQWDWLLGALLGSTARWKFIVQSVVWNPTFSSGGGDSWAGYLIEQQALIDFLANNGVVNVVIVSGDRHFAGMDDGSHSVFPEFAMGPLNTGPLQPVGDWQSVFSGQRAFGLVEIRTNPDRVVMTICDESGAPAATIGPNPLVIAATGGTSLPPPPPLSSRKKGGGCASGGSPEGAGILIPVIIGLVLLGWRRLR